MTEILGLRRQSTGNEVINSIKIKNNNYRSFTQSAHQSIEMCEQFNSFKEENKIIKNNKNTSSLPQIEINGVNQEKEINEEKKNNSDIQQNTEINLEINSLNNQKGESEYSSAIPLYFKHKAQKVDSRKIAAKKRLERGQTTSGSDNSSQNAKKVCFKNYSSVLSTEIQISHRLGAHSHFNNFGNRDGAIHIDFSTTLASGWRSCPINVLYFWYTPFLRIIFQPQRMYLKSRFTNSSFSERTLAKSLDNKHTDNTFLFDLKPLQSNIKCSPNHHSQQRLGSVGNVFGLINLNNRLFSSNIEINILNFEQSETIQKTWLLANEKIRLFAGPDRSFAFFTFDRIFERAPELKSLFGISPNISIFELDENQWDQHPFSRHVRIFNNILDLSVRNSAELEKEMLPVLFAYGQRHYRANIKEHFNEKSVRLFCSQIIGTLCDLLDKKLNLFAQEAWIEMVTYLGRALLSGFLKLFLQK
uniref:Globin family profile domain-containing protein n=1 Tax=Meloidogyne incognita TaxID=6306 RepID=A0A914NMU4_MELIC